MHYAENSRQHRDCILGCSFPLCAWDYFPKGRERPAELRTACEALLAIHHGLAVDALSRGALRDIDKACELAADAGIGYDSEWPSDEVWKGWLKMFFLGWYAMTDAVNTAHAWVAKQAENWRIAQQNMDILYGRWLKKFPREEMFACRVWCSEASPYAHKELKEFLSEN